MKRVNIRALRKRLGLSQTEFARDYLLPVATVRQWEQGSRRPNGPAAVLLFLIAHDPQMVLRALHPGKTAKASPGPANRPVRAVLMSDTRLVRSFDPDAAP